MKSLAYLATVLALCAELSAVNAAKTFVIPIIRTNWYLAHEFCNSLGMQLATVNSVQDNQELIAFIKTTDKYDSVKSFFWIGATDLATEGIFTWVFNGGRVTFSQWAIGQPSGKASEHCVLLKYIPAQGMFWEWDDVLCRTLTEYFICESRPNSCDALSFIAPSAKNWRAAYESEWGALDGISTD